MGRQAGRAACLILIVAATALSVPTGAAAVAPVVPDPVAPGVPGNGRAWELVTPPDPVSAKVTTVHATASSGDRIAYQSDGPMPGAENGILWPSNIATRGAGGWQTTPINAPQPLAPLTPETKPAVFSSDLSAWVSTRDELDQATELPIRTLYRSQPGGGYAEIAEIGTGAPTVFAASEDLQRVVFSSEGHLLPADAARTEGASIYEIVGSTLGLVDVDDDGSLVSNCGSAPNAVSGDGLRIVFSSNPACGPFTRVFLREGGETTEISASRCTLPDCGSPATIHFSAATPSGDSTFLATPERLTDDDLDAAPDLYRYDTADGSLTLVSSPPALAEGEATVYHEPIRPSVDGSRVYFFTDRPLRPGEGVADQVSLYFAGPDGLDFVAAGPSTNVTASADGRFAVFATTAPLSVGDSDENVDLYRYDAATRTSVRVSGGIGGRGNGAFDPALGALADNGRVFFSTDEQLLPEDGNDKTDVYEWSGGQTSLVSSGTPEFGGTFAGATPDAGTVFVKTNATLLGVDRDNGDGDLYAARIGGGFPEPPPPPGPICEGQACVAVAPGERAARPGPRSAGKAVTRIEAGRVDAAARRLLLAKGRATLLVEVPAAGRLVAKGTARLGPGRRIVVTGAVVAKQAGPALLPLRLTAEGRAGLARGKALRVSLALRLKGLRAAHRTSFTIGGGRK